MTCIVGLIDNGNIWIGGDSAGIRGTELIIRKDPKVFRSGDFVIGYSSSFRMGQLLAHAFTPPARDQSLDVYSYMVTVFVDALRSCFKNGGYAEKQNEAERGGTFLVGYEKRLFCIEGDYQVGENADGYAACGSGAVIALGSLYSTIGQAPQARVLLALEAAEHFSTEVCAPFQILSSTIIFSD